MNPEYQLYAVCDECGCEALFSPDETHPLCPSCRTPIPVNRLKKYTGAAGGSPGTFSKKDMGFIIEGTRLIRYSGNDECVIIPETITAINAYAFVECTSIREIRIPDLITVIPHGAFEHCANLEQMILPANVKIIETDAFNGCDKLDYHALFSKIITSGHSVSIADDWLEEKYRKALKRNEAPAKPKRKTIPIYVYALAALLLLAAGLFIFNPLKPAPASGSAKPANEPVQTETPSNAKSEGVMTYSEYMAAAIDDKVTIEAYVQAKQSWWDNRASFFVQDGDGAYFIYEMAISEEDFNKLTEGRKIKITGYKSEWAGHIEIVNADFEIEEGNWIAAPLDVTDLLGTDELESHMNQKVLFKGVTVEAAELSNDAFIKNPDEDSSDGNHVVGYKPAGQTAFMYGYNGSGAQGDDVYFTVSKDGRNYTFLVRNHLTDRNTDVYKAAEALEIGETYDMEGYLYWYEGPNPWITDIRKH